MIKTGAYIIAFMILCSFANAVINYTIEKEIDNRTPYYLSFASIGVISLESRLDCWAKIKTTSTSHKMKQDMLSLLNCLDIPVKANQMQVITNRDATILQYELSQKQKQFKFTFCSDRKKNESCYMLKFSSKDKSDHIEQYREKIKGFRDDLAWNYNYQYSGEINNKIESISQQKILKVIMKNLAVEDSKMFTNENEVFSIGLSPKITNIVPAVVKNGHMYNIEAQIQSAKAGKTLVYIGSPQIITNNY